MDTKPFSLLAFKKTGLVFLAAVLILAGAAAMFPEQVFAQPTAQDGDPPPPVDFVPVANEDCLACHQLPDMYLPLPSGEQLDLTVDPEKFAESIHGEQGYACVQCHTNITGYPHPELSVENRREVSIQLTQACMNCHTGQADAFAEGRHAQEFVKGNLNTALCVDCHTSHEVKDIRGSKVEIAKTCQRCHSEIYDIYKDSVHGAALLEEENFDVPTCSDCHENHNNTGPGDPGFVLFSPQICAKCHADEELMTKYGVNTEVFDTYVSDFHGTTVTIFERVSPDQETNKPVCIDCHGVHNILPPTDANSSVMKDNLLKTCQRCHPDAASDFSESWLSHYPPDLEHNTIVFLVNLFYWILIPGTIGGMAVFVGSNVWRNYQLKKAAGEEGE